MPIASFGRAIRVVWKTDRGAWHQGRTRRAAPDGVELSIVREADSEELRGLLADADILVSERSVPVEPWELECAPNLRLLVRLGSVPDRLPAEEAVSRGIAVSLEPVPLCAVCAEHGILLALALLRDLVGTTRFVHEAAALVPSRRTDEDTFAYNWTGRRSLGTLRGARIGILGMGGIGVELALRLRAFGPRSVRYTKRVPFTESIERTLGAFAGSPSDIVSTSDVLFCLLPFSAQTEGWLNADRIASMPAGSRLVCLGSGSVVDEGAVLGAVRAGHLAGAAFDTFEWEPLPTDHPLAAAARSPGSRIILTPHVAALGSEADATLGWDEIGRWMRGEALLHRIG